MTQQERTAIKAERDIAYTDKIAELEKELKAKDILIAQLDITIKEYSDTVKALTKELTI